MVAGVANPRGVLGAARRAGYRARAFEAARLPFGLYTSQAHVRAWIARLERQGLAHTLGDEEGGYVCAAVEFERVGDAGGDKGGRGVVEARLLELLTAAEALPRDEGGVVVAAAAEAA